MQPSCEVDTKMLIQSQVFHFRMENMITATKLNLLLNFFRMKHLWDEIQIQLRIQNKSIANARFVNF